MKHLNIDIDSNLYKELASHGVNRPYMELSEEDKKLVHEILDQDRKDSMRNLMVGCLKSAWKYKTPDESLKEE